MTCTMSGCTQCYSTEPCVKHCRPVCCKFSRPGNGLYSFQPHLQHKVLYNLVNIRFLQPDGTYTVLCTHILYVREFPVVYEKFCIAIEAFFFFFSCMCKLQCAVASKNFSLVTREANRISTQCALLLRGN